MLRAVLSTTLLGGTYIAAALLAGLDSAAAAERGVAVPAKACRLHGHQGEQWGDPACVRRSRHGGNHVGY
jgi:hypothetical protein